MNAIARPADPKQLLKPGILIDGEWLPTGSGGERQHTDPATGRVQQAFALAGETEVDSAVLAARRALTEWRHWAPTRRQDVLNRLGQLIRENADELAAINALEVGTPANLSAMRYRSGPTFFEYYAGWLDKAAGDTFRAPGMIDFTLLEPIGVVAAILTWNHPLANIQTSVAPALAAGCSVVIKPPDQAPFAALRFGRLCEEAGIPAGVVNILPGGPDVGDALVRHDDVDMVSFIGGTTVGRRIQAAAAPTLKPLLLELGGKSASLVFDDADVDEASQFALRIASNTGQGCTIPTRLLVQESVYEKVVERVTELLKTVQVGDPFSPDVAMGPLVNEAALERVLSVIDRAVEERSGRLVAGGRRIGSEGYFVEPTVFADVEPTSPLSTEEIFGPVLSITPFSTESDAVRLANLSEYGLAGYVHTRDTSRAIRVASQLDVGNVGINGGGAPAGAFAPFGGVKQSGYGKVGGLAGLLQFSRVKNVLLNVEEGA